MHRIKRWWLAVAVAGALIGVAGAGAVMAQTPSSTPAAQSTQTQSSGTPAAGSTATAAQSNEDPTHEAGETAEQEAAEDAGQGHAGHNCPKDQATPSANATPSSNG